MNLTTESINKLPPPALRKAVKDLGQDPMSAKFGKGDIAKMKAFLLSKVAAKPVAAVRPAVRPVAAKPAAKPAAPAKAVAKPVAAKVPPAMPVTKPAAKPAVAAKPPAPAKPAPAAPAVTAKENAGEKAWKESVELRLATLEANAGISQASVSSEAVPVSNLASLDAYVVVNEESGEQNYEIDIAQVSTLSQEQLIACGELFGKPFKPNTPVRVMRSVVEAELRALMGGTAEAPAAEEPEAPTGPGEYVEGNAYEVGHIVAARYGEDVYDPCRIEKVFTNKAGEVTGYDVWFQADNTIAKVEHENIVGISETPIE